MSKSNFIPLSSGHIINAAAIRWIWRLSDGGFAVIFGPDSTHETVDLDLAAGRELLAHLGLR